MPSFLYILKLHYIHPLLPELPESCGGAGWKSQRFRLLLIIYEVPDTDTQELSQWFWLLFNVHEGSN